MLCPDQFAKHCLSGVYARWHMFVCSPSEEDDNHAKSEGTTSMLKGWWWRDIWLSATGPTGRAAEDREPLAWSYVRRLTGLLVRRRLRLATFLWALRARPASVCGIGGSHAVATWIE